MKVGVLNRWLFGVLATLLIASVYLIARSTYERHMRALDRELMRSASDEAVRRIRSEHESRESIQSLYNGSALAKARSLARIVANEPAIVGDLPRFQQLASLLDVDEIHVSDGDGVVIASLPAKTIGYRMDSNPQSAAFLGAITNREFELVQEPMLNGSVGRRFQYAGVARIDSPGIVQVGFFPERLESLLAPNAIDAKIAAIKVGHGGSIALERLDRGESHPLYNLPRFLPPAYDPASGGRVGRVVCDCGDRRIVVKMPLYGTFFADDDWYSILLATSLALALLLAALSVFTFCRNGLKLMLTSFKIALNGESLRSMFSRRGGIFNLVVGAAIIFVLGLFITSAVGDRASREWTQNLLSENAKSIRDDIRSCADALLYYVGNAITRYYRTPQKMSQEAVHEIMRRYDIDEVNIVDADGIVLAGELAQIGFDFHSNTNSAEFLRLLEDTSNYAQDFRAAIEDKSIVRKYVGTAFPQHNGFVQIGLDQHRLAGDIDYRIIELADGWHIAEGGYFIVARREDGAILSCGSDKWSPSPDDRDHDHDQQTLADIGFDFSAVDDRAGQMCEQVLFGEECFCVSLPVTDYHVAVIALPKSEAFESRDKALAVVAIILLSVLTLALLVGAWMNASNRRLRDFIAEDQKRQLEDERRRSEELENARLIQVESLPVVFPDEPEYSIMALMDTAKEVGGDFFDFYTVPSGRVFFVVADVSGKGIPAALFMMKAKTMLRASAFECRDLVTAVAETNSRLAEQNDANMFVTAWLGCFDPANGEIEFVNAGHNPPIIRRADGSIEWVRAKRRGIVLAAAPAARYHSETITLGRGDRLLLYTDGVTEAMNLSEEQYGERRLEQDFTAAVSPRPAEEIRERVAEFAAGAEQSDDITMLVLTRK